MTLAGYEIGEQLHAGDETRVFRGRRSADQLPVVIKAHSSPTPSIGAINRLQREYAIGRQLDGCFVPRYLALEPYRNGLAIIEEDFGAADLLEEYPQSIRSEAVQSKLMVQAARERQGYLLHPGQRRGL